ncbi:MAG: hypothetical protein JSW05_13575 [Candidatus Thorarchaeota archaeon]|nr:MAG: hypothetical protein JSW05_13575 [Candidatus Thorarchaeota archaeon]
MRPLDLQDKRVVDVAYSYRWNFIQYSAGSVTYKTTRIIKIIWLGIAATIQFKASIGHNVKFFLLQMWLLSLR